MEASREAEPAGKHPFLLGCREFINGKGFSQKRPINVGADALQSVRGARDNPAPFVTTSDRHR